MERCVRVPRRFTLELEVFPCERPKKRPEPEEAAAEYYPCGDGSRSPDLWVMARPRASPYIYGSGRLRRGAYVESGTELTVMLELAAPLNAESAPRPAAELQRIVTLIRYSDTPTLLGLLNVVKVSAHHSARFQPRAA